VSTEREGMAGRDEKKDPSVQIDGSMSVRKRDMARSKLGVEEKHPLPL
jgi:hypothetical protein